MQSEPYFGSISSNKFINLFFIINSLFIFYQTQLEREKIKLKRESGRFWKIHLKAGEVGVSEIELNIVNNNYNSGFYMAHISTYKDAQGTRIIITPALAPATKWRTVHFKELKP